MKKWLLLLLVLAAAAVGWGVLRKSAPPKIPVARVQRQTLISTLPTNGKVEPFEWQAVRAEIAGIINKLDIHEGQRVGQGQTLATITDPTLQADIETAEAKVAEARAGLASLQAGGRPSDFTDIETSASPKNKLPPAPTSRPRATRCIRRNSRSPASRSAAAHWSPSRM